MLTDFPNTRYVWRFPALLPAIMHRCWDDHCVVFCQGAGDTLLLTRTAWQILATISNKTNGVSFVELLMDLGCSEPDAELMSLLQRTLGHFESLQLIESVTD